MELYVMQEWCVYAWGELQWEHEGKIHQYAGTNKCAEYNKYRERRRPGAEKSLLVSRVRRDACKYVEPINERGRTVVRRLAGRGAR